MEKSRKNGVKLKLKVIFEALMAIFFMASFLFFLWKTVDTRIVHTVSFLEKGDTGYKVYLLENVDYPDEYLEEGMQYISDIVDKVNVNYKYELQFNKKMNTELKYSIIAHLTIKDSSTKNILYEQKDFLVEEKSLDREDFQTLQIYDDVDVDFQKYNTYVVNFKNRYLLSTESNLRVTLILNSSNEYSEFLENKNIQTSLNVDIPLGTRTVSITKDNYENTNVFTEVSNHEVINYIYLIFAAASVLLVIAALISFFKHFRIYRGRDTAYKKELSKILNEYDRIIVETTELVNTDEYNIVDVKSFSELVDARDNINKPIIFAEIIRNRKSIFYVIDNKVLYRLVLEEKTNEEKS